MNKRIEILYIYIYKDKKNGPCFFYNIIINYYIFLNNLGDFTPWKQRNVKAKTQYVD